VLKLETLLETEMTRKQFVVAVASTMVGLTGLSTILGLFTKNLPEQHSANPGYGDRDYGP
jgi:hypothetical protein